MQTASGQSDDDPVLKRLRLLGAHVQVDEAGQARHIRFAGRRFNDASVVQLAGITGLESIDVRDTSITPRGVKRLQELMPGVVIQFRE
jgi:hypothetical protein